MADVLDQEIRAFEKMLPNLRKEFGSVWAVVVGDDLKGSFSDFEGAALFAVEKFANDSVLIRHTQEHIAHIPFIAVDA